MYLKPDSVFTLVFSYTWEARVNNEYLINFLIVAQKLFSNEKNFLIKIEIIDCGFMETSVQLHMGLVR